MYMIEIKEDEYSELSENMTKALRYGGKVMDCIERMKQNGRMGERMPDYRNRWMEHEERREPDDYNRDWNYGGRYGERGGGYHGGNR